jgi:hypothetical protein
VDSAAASAPLRHGRTAIVAAAWLTTVGIATPAQAQSPARFSIDSAISVDVFRGENALDRPNIIVDVTAVTRLGKGWLAYVRPWLRQPRTTAWDKQIYQAALQYSRHDAIATRLDLGYIASPIGIGMLDTRPGINPTIAPHFSYFTPLPAFDASAPRVLPIAATYPLGGMFTASTAKWDARAAIVNTMPTRIFIINNAVNPRAAAAIEGGVGVNPKIGMRLGASFARGQYATKDELKPSGSADEGRMATLTSIEGEYAFAFTKITGEVTHGRFEVPSGTATSYAWFVQGTQTLTPRWFAAARYESALAPTAPTLPAGTGRPTLRYSEATAGYRLTTEFTVRTSVMGRKSFTRSDWDRQVGVSLVWARRWW